MTTLKTRAAGLGAVAVLSGLAFAPAAVAATSSSSAPAKTCTAATSSLKRCSALVTYGVSGNKIVVKVSGAQPGTQFVVHIGSFRAGSVKVLGNSTATFTTLSQRTGRTYRVTGSGTSRYTLSHFSQTQNIRIPVPKKKGSAKASFVTGSAGGATTGTTLVSATTSGSASTGAASSAAAQPAGGLAFTGAEIGGMSILGAGLLGGGTSLVLVGRKRRKTV